MHGCLQHIASHHVGATQVHRSYVEPLMALLESGYLYWVRHWNVDWNRHLHGKGYGPLDDSSGFCVHRNGSVDVDWPVHIHHALLGYHYHPLQCGAPSRAHRQGGRLTLIPSTPCGDWVSLPGERAVRRASRGSGFPGVRNPNCTRLVSRGPTGVAYCVGGRVVCWVPGSYGACGGYTLARPTRRLWIRIFSLLTPDPQGDPAVGVEERVPPHSCPLARQDAGRGSQATMCGVGLPPRGGGNAARQGSGVPSGGNLTCHCLVFRLGPRRVFFCLGSQIFCWVPVCCGACGGYGAPCPTWRH